MMKPLDRGVFFVFTFVAAAGAFAWVMGQRAWALGFFGGVLLFCGNYSLWKRVVHRLITKQDVKKASGLFFLKIGVNALAVFALIHWIKADALAFLIAIGIGVLGLVLAGLRSSDASL